MKPSAKVIAFLFGLSAFGTSQTHITLFERYAKAGCPAPVPAQCTVRVDNHNVVTYISSDQSETLEKLWAAFLVSAGLAVAVFGAGHFLGTRASGQDDQR